jgi:hypothetical protein
MDRFKKLLIAMAYYTFTPEDLVDTLDCIIRMLQCLRDSTPEDLATVAEFVNTYISGYARIMLVTLDVFHDVEDLSKDAELTHDLELDLKAIAKESKLGQRLAALR